MPWAGKDLRRLGISYGLLQFKKKKKKDKNLAY
jgi:hypothetical protein